MTTPPVVNPRDPAVVHVPAYQRSLGDEAGTVLDELGVRHMPWHDLVLRHAMAVTDNDRWVARDVALVCPWPDDKHRVVSMREIIGASLLAERVLHTCPDTVLVKTFDALLALIDSAPALQCMVQKVRRAHGDQGIWFQGGGVIRFIGLGRNGRDRARGESADLLVFDYAATISERDEEVVSPVLAARPNPQVWWVDTEPGGPFGWLRGRAQVSTAPEVLYLEWTDNIA